MLKSLFLAVTIVGNSPGYYTSLANHIKRWLAGEQVQATVIAPDSMPAMLKNERTVFLVGLDSPSAAQMKALRDLVDRGGRIVSFHSSSKQLADLMGVKCTGFRSAAYPGQWSRMDFTTARPSGAPLSIRQTSGVLNTAAPAPGRGGRTLAVWADRNGRATGDAAWIATPAGWWMTHVLTADGDERLKAQLVASFVGVSEPDKWSAAKSLERREMARKAVKDYAAAQSPRKGEVRAVWDHSGCGLYPGDWPRTMRLLKNAHVTDIFVNVAGAGFAHYASNVLPRSKTFADEGDQLSACIKAAAGTGVRVHAWILCFTATRSAPGVAAEFDQRGWLLKTPAGKKTEYLDPSKREVRERVLGAIDEILARYAVDGIHLDFVRWYEGAAKPSNAASVISDFVLAARRKVKRPRWLTAAVLGKYPVCIASVGQDWCSWLDSNALDYVVPMDYTEDNARFDGYLAQHAAVKSRARRTIAGIGVTANESRLDARQVIDQINLARRRSLAGVALFDLDTVLEKDILPYLAMGVWRTR